MVQINVPGLAGLIVFYFLILFAGLFSKKLMSLLNNVDFSFGRKKKAAKPAETQVEKGLSDTDDLMLAGRDINYFVGIFTMTATWVGGGYINGAAEATIKDGILWCQAPFCYAVALICGGLFFASKMRNMKYVTMLDPLQNKYGKELGALFYIPAFSGEILWSAAILAALGTSLQVICGIPESTSIMASAGFAMIYTLFGGLYSVAFTDVFQLICIFVGLILALPFMTSNENVTTPLQDKMVFNGQDKSIFGTIKSEDAALWVDHAVFMMCGGIPWQAYFQRVLSSRDAKVARVLSVFAGFGCFCAAIPAVVVGVITLNTDWTNVEGVAHELNEGNYKLAVPLCLNYLCPPVITFIGLGAVSAAVMSSTDSSVLGVSCMFTRNVFQRVFYPKATDKQMMWALRGTIVVNTTIAMVIAITVKSVYGLYLICSDLVFVLLFPHLVLVIHFPHLVNRYGMVVGFFTAFLLRALSGEPVLGYDAILKFPGYAEGENGKVGHQKFPFRIICMIIHLLLCLAVTRLTDYLYQNGHMTDKMDVLKEYSSENTNKSNGNKTDVVIENSYPIEALKNGSSNGTSNGVVNGKNGEANGHKNGYTNGHC
ncbi:hypothetical protein ACHWQZ_G012379 [Mnemiopsis leidyi]